MSISQHAYQSSFLQAIIIIIAYVHLSVTETHQPKKIITISHHAHQPSSPLSSISESHHVYQPTFLSAIIPISHHICQLSCPCSSAIMPIMPISHHSYLPSYLLAIIPIYTQAYQQACLLGCSIGQPFVEKTTILAKTLCQT